MNNMTILNHDYMKLAGITQYRLAKLLETDDQSVGRVLKGKALPGIIMARKYAAALGIPLDSLQFPKETLGLPYRDLSSRTHQSDESVCSTT
jgi:transcriptional regulator with XRE-family HTH domain